MKKMMFLLLVLLTQFVPPTSHAAALIGEKKMKLTVEMAQELTIAPRMVAGEPVLEKHLQELITDINTGKVKIEFQEDLGKNRGSSQTDSDCDCSTIDISAKYVDSGILTTMIHEFKKIKLELAVEELLKKDKELDKLVDIFGDYYYQNDQSTKQKPEFEKSLFIGSALLFYMEYDASKMQLKAISKGIKDTFRKEKSNAEIANNVVSDYLTNRNIKVDADFAAELSQLADKMPIGEFLSHMAKNKNLQDYFTKLQK